MEGREKAFFPTGTGSPLSVSEGYWGQGGVARDLLIVNVFNTHTHARAHPLTQLHFPLERYSLDPGRQTSSLGSTFSHQPKLANHLRAAVGVSVGLLGPSHMFSPWVQGPTRLVLSLLGRGSGRHLLKATQLACVEARISFMYLFIH